MSSLEMMFAFALPVLALAAAVFVCYRTMKTTGNVKKAFSRHFVTLIAAVVLCLGFTVFASAASADTAAAADAAGSAASVANTAAGFGFIGAALSIGLSCIGAGIALAGSSPAAIGAIAEDPKAFGKAMIFVVLGESVAIYGLIISIMILLRIPALM